MCDLNCWLVVTSSRFLIDMTLPIIWLHFPDLVPESTGIESTAVSTMELHTVKVLKFNICVLASYFCAQALHTIKIVNTNMRVSVL